MIKKSPYGHFPAYSISFDILLFYLLPLSTRLKNRTRTSWQFTISYLVTIFRLIFTLTTDMNPGSPKWLTPLLHFLESPGRELPENNLPRKTQNAPISNLQALDNTVIRHSNVPDKNFRGGNFLVWAQSFKKKWRFGIKITAIRFMSFFFLCFLKGRD